MSVCARMSICLWLCVHLSLCLSDSVSTKKKETKIWKRFVECVSLSVRMCELQCMCTLYSVYVCEHVSLSLFLQETLDQPAVNYTNPPG